LETTLLALSSIQKAPKSIIRGERKETKSTDKEAASSRHPKKL
jgi:hypothetical protein